MQYLFTVNWFLVKFNVNVYMEAHRLMSLPSLATVLLARCSGVSIKGTVLSVSALLHLVLLQVNVLVNYIITIATLMVVPYTRIPIDTSGCSSESLI